MFLLPGKPLEISHDGIFLGVLIPKGDGEAAVMGSGFQDGSAAHIDDRAAVHGKVLETVGIRFGGSGGSFGA